jgi:hypothetical protein
MFKSESGQPVSLGPPPIERYCFRRVCHDAGNGRPHGRMCQLPSWSSSFNDSGESRARHALLSVFGAPSSRTDQSLIPASAEAEADEPTRGRSRDTCGGMDVELQ